jgi:molybdopterin-guanine dinucleotide biosynthesis protein B
MVPIISVVGYSKSGKTTLIEKLIPVLTRRGFRIGTVKHAPHGFDLDQPGKDGSRHLAAGAATTIVTGPAGLAVFKTDENAFLPLDRLRKYFIDVDLVISEGYKKDDKPKIAVITSATGEPPVDLDDEMLLAVFSDITPAAGPPVFNSRQVELLADLIVSRFLSTPGAASG